jgi:hypothetical protein
MYKLNDVNEIFNSFINKYLLLFESCFPKQNLTNKLKDNGWITAGIRTSCRRKESLKKAVFWDVALCRSGVNRRFGGTYRLHLQGRREIIRKSTRKASVRDVKGRLERNPWNSRNPCSFSVETVTTLCLNHTINPTS